MKPERTEPLRDFASPMDALAARQGIPSLFILDHENRWRMESDLTRDAYQRLQLQSLNTEPPRDPAYALFCDNNSRYVARFFTTARDLLRGHPRGVARFYETEEEADQAYAALGTPPLADEDWIEGGR